MIRSFLTILGLFLLLTGPGAEAVRPPKSLFVSEATEAWKQSQLQPSAADPPNPTWCKNYTPNNYSIPRFPKDLGRHDESQSEYWFHAGTLSTAEGRKFGVELNFLMWNPTHCDGTTPFLANGLFVVSDVEANRLLNRSTAQPAWPSLGVRFSSVPFEVTVDKDWYIRQIDGGEQDWDQLIAVVVPGAADPGKGASEDMGMKLRLQVRPPFNIHNGIKGFEIDDDRVSEDGEPIGSMHVAQPRVEVLPGSHLFINGTAIEVTGMLWMQHMWLSTARTSRDKLFYWNWFHFRFSNGWLLEFTYFRLEDGSPTPYPNGNLWSPNADVNIHFGLEAITLKESNLWRSPKTGNEYYIWHDVEIRVPGHEIQISTRPLIDDNEILDPIGAPNCYYEGAATGFGRHNGAAITTEGYTEVVGKYICEFD